MRPEPRFLLERSPGTHIDALPGRTVKSYLVQGKIRLPVYPLSREGGNQDRFILDECVGDFQSLTAISARNLRAAYRRAGMAGGQTSSPLAGQFESSFPDQLRYVKD